MELKRRNLTMHVQVLQGLNGCDMKEGERVEDVLGKMQPLVGPTFVDFQDVISNAIRELRRVEEEQKLELTTKAPPLPPRSGMPQGLEAWNQANEKFKTKEWEYSDLLCRYTTLWQVYNQLRADLLKSYHKKTPALSIGTIEEEEEEVEEEEETIAEAMPQAVTLISAPPKDERKGELHKEWKDDLQFSKDAYDEGVISQQDYKNQVRGYLQMAAILQQKCTLLGKTFAELRIREALAVKIEGILNEVGVKKQQLIPRLKQAGLSDYSEELEGLNDMEKSLRIQQEQIFLTLAIQESHSRVRLKLLNEMNQIRMDIIEEESESLSSTSSSPPLQTLASPNVHESIPEEDEERSDRSERSGSEEMEIPSPTERTPSSQFPAAETQFRQDLTRKESDTSDDEAIPDDFKIQVSSSRPDVMRKISLGLEPGAFLSGPPSVDKTDHPSHCILPHVPSIHMSTDAWSMLDSVDELTFDQDAEEAEVHPELYYPDIIPPERSILRKGSDFRPGTSRVKAHGISLLPDDPTPFLSVRGEHVHKTPTGRRRRSSIPDAAAEERKVSVLPFLTSSGPSVSAGTSRRSSIKGERAGNMMLLGMDSVVTHIPSVEKINVCLALPKRPHSKTKPQRHPAMPSHPPDRQADQKLSAPTTLFALSAHSIPTSPRRSLRTSTSAKTQRKTEFAGETKPHSFGFEKRARTRSPVSAPLSPIPGYRDDRMLFPKTGIPDLPGLRRGSLLAPSPGSQLIHVADVAASLPTKDEPMTSASTSPKLKQSGRGSITPRGSRLLNRYDLKEYLDTLPSPRDPAPERDQRPLIHDKLQTMHQQHDQATKRLSHHTALTPRPPSEAVSGVKGWMETRDRSDTPRAVTALPRPTKSLAAERMQQSRSVRRVLIKRRRQVRAFSPALSLSEASLTPVSCDRISTTPSVVPSLTDGFQKWSAPKRVQGPMLESRLFCLDINQDIRKAERAMREINNDQLKNVAKDPSCVHIWNKFQVNLRPR